MSWYTPLHFSSRVSPPIADPVDLEMWSIDRRVDETIERMIASLYRRPAWAWLAMCLDTIWIAEECDKERWPWEDV